MKPTPNKDGILSPRGGSVLFRRYALQHYEIEEGKLPDPETGEPRGDRLKALRKIHANMDIGGGKKAAELSTTELGVYPEKYEYTEDKDDPLNKNHIFLKSPSP